jgi:hypothetical protein
MKTELPMDSSGLTFIDIMPPEPVLDRQTKYQKADAGGSHCPRSSSCASRPRAERS